MYSLEDLRMLKRFVLLRWRIRPKTTPVLLFDLTLLTLQAPTPRNGQTHSNMWKFRILVGDWKIFSSFRVILCKGGIFFLEAGGLIHLPLPFEMQDFENICPQLMEYSFSFFTSKDLSWVRHLSFNFI